MSPEDLTEKVGCSARSSNSLVHLCARRSKGEITKNHILPSFPMGFTGRKDGT